MIRIIIQSHYIYVSFVVVLFCNYRLHSPLMNAKSKWKLIDLCTCIDQHASIDILEIIKYTLCY